VSSHPYVHQYGKKGPAVLFLHSLFFDGTMFEEVAKRLPVRAFCPDFRGMGKRKNDQGDISVESHVTDIIRYLCTDLKEPVHLVGSSMGAYVGVRVASRMPPKMISSVTLLCCTAQAEEEPEKFSRICNQVEKDPVNAAKTVERIMFGESFLNSMSKSLKSIKWREHFQSLHPRAADVARNVFARSGMETELKAMPKAPLLIAGGQDRAKRPEDMHSIAELIPGSHVVMIEQAGHTPAIETPALLAKHLSRWFDRASILD